MTLFKEQDQSLHKFMLWVRMNGPWRHKPTAHEEYLKEQKIMKEMNE